MKQSSNKNQIKSVCIGLIFGVLWFAIYWLLLWKIPFYLHLNSIQLPSDSEVIVTKVGMTDEGAWWHVVAQNVFVSSLKIDEVKQYMATENGIESGGEYALFEFYNPEIPYGRIIHSWNYDKELPEIEGKTYYTFFYRSLRNNHIINAVYVFGFISTIIVCVICTVVLKN